MGRGDVQVWGGVLSQKALVWGGCWLGRDAGLGRDAHSEGVGLERVGVEDAVLGRDAGLGGMQVCGRMQVWGGMLIWRMLVWEGCCFAGCWFGEGCQLGRDARLNDAGLRGMLEWSGGIRAGGGLWGAQRHT